MSKTILLADDSVTIQKVVELTFMDQDYEIVATSDGSSALDRLAQQRPDLVIADVHMPGADGYEVCRRTKQEQPGVPVLLLVGTFEQFDQDKAAKVGADGHLKKPFDSQELLGQVETLIARAAQAGAAPVAEPAEPEPASVEPAEEPKPEADAADPFSFDEPGIEELEPPALLDEEPEPPAFAAPAPEPAAPVEESAPAEPPAEPAEPAEPTPVFDAEPEPAPAPAETRAETPAAGNGSRPLEDEELERIARRVVELMGERLVRDVAWEVIPDLAEVIIKERIRELESQLE